MSDIPTTLIALDGVDPEELEPMEAADLVELVREHVQEDIDPDRLDVVLLDEDQNTLKA